MLFMKMSSLINDFENVHFCNVKNDDFHTLYVIKVKDMRFVQKEKDKYHILMHVYGI